MSLQLVRRSRATLSATTVLLSIATHLAAQPNATEWTPRERVVVATVNDAEILQAEWDAWLAELPEAQREAAKPSLLDTLVDRQLVLDYLAARSLGASEQEIDLELRRWTKRLASRDTTPSAYYAETGMDEAALRRLFAWKIGWFRYAEKQLTEPRVAKYFETHRRDFDGSQLRVAHILWKGEAKDLPQLIATATETRQAILDGELAFETAARTRSQAPTAENGGEVGWIERRHPMHPAFSTAAFRLEAGQISEPVVSPFGVHLIRCLEVRPGERELASVRDQVVSAARQRLFRNLAKRQQPARVRLSKTGDER